MGVGCSNGSFHLCSVCLGKFQVVIQKLWPDTLCHPAADEQDLWGFCQHWDDSCPCLTTEESQIPPWFPQLARFFWQPGTSVRATRSKNLFFFFLMPILLLTPPQLKISLNKGLFWLSFLSHLWKKKSVAMYSKSCDNVMLCDVLQCWIHKLKGLNTR